MLLKRIITAVFLLAILLPVLFFGSPNLWSSLSLILIAAAVWEWSRMNGYHSVRSTFFAIDVFAVCAALLYLGVARYTVPTLWLFASSFWVLLSYFLLKSGVANWVRLPRLLRLLGGILSLMVAWLALVQLRELGINLLLSVLLLVWSADIMAYIAGRLLGGRLFGQRKLAITISPGKTWEGVMGGFVGVCLVAWLWLWLDHHYGLVKMGSPSLYTLLAAQSFWFAPFALIFFTMMAVVGDLIESLVKRSAGIKDSSGLLPGHGGVLDRIDALLPVLPVAMFFVSLTAWTSALK